MLIPFDQLFARHNVEPVGVLHLGANTGQEAEAYHKQGVKRVIWIEANPDLMPALKKYLEPYPLQRAICACVSDQTGTSVTFHIANNDGQSSSFLEFGTHAKEHPSVRYCSHIHMRTDRVDELFHLLGISLEPRGWFLNVDIQGAELLALKGMGSLLWQFNWAYIEVNERELYKGCPLVGEIDAYLQTFGFAGVETKMTGAGWGDKLYVRV